VIFVTVGSVLPFDRLVRTMDAWAAANPDVEVCAQIGQRATFRPGAMTSYENLPKAAFAEMVRGSALVVSHAGMGSIVTAREAGKPIVVMPRRAALREHTTDHQMHTADAMRSAPGIFVAEDETALAGAIARALGAGDVGAIGPWASDELIGNLRTFFATVVPARRT
jgi:UDP-N-acetylglucosamine transferase subunit ALG13